MKMSRKERLAKTIKLIEDCVALNAGVERIQFGGFSLDGQPDIFSDVYRYFKKKGINVKLNCRVEINPQSS